MTRITVFSLIERSINNMGAINPKVKNLVVELIIRSYHIGINVQITSGLRTYAEQTKLYNQGRTTPGNIVTNAKAGQSIHNFGLALDYVLVSEDGTKAFWDINRNMNGNQVRDWFEVAAIGKQLGFAWGGDWKSFKDYPHLDMQKGYTLASLRAGKRPTIPNVPNRGYYGPGDIGDCVGGIQVDLIKVGYKITKDKIYGKDTEEGVKEFQRANGLLPDGIWGSASQVKLDAILANLAKPSTSKTEAGTSEKTKGESKVEYKKDAPPSKSIVEEFHESKENGFTDGTYPQRPATREEVAVMVNRGYKRAVETTTAEIMKRITQEETANR